MSIAYLPHTADIRMSIHEKSLEELFKQSVIGMNHVLKEKFCDEVHGIDKEVNIEVSAVDRTVLLIDFLSDVLTSTYIEKAVFCHVEIIEFSQCKINARLSGSCVEQFDEEIKAVTYHEANIVKNNKNLWETCVIFDI